MSGADTRVAWLAARLQRRPHARPQRRWPTLRTVLDGAPPQGAPSPFKQGHAAGWREGHEQGRKLGLSEGYSAGYADGLRAGAAAGQDG